MREDPSLTIEPGEAPLTFARDMKEFGAWLAMGPITLPMAIFRAVRRRR